MKHLALMLLIISGVPRTATAQTAWMFDFDIKLTADQAYVNNQLNILKAGLPGLPPDGIVELVSKQTKLYLYQDIIDTLVRARDSGPATVPAVTRTPKRCVKHFSFVKPSLLLGSPSPQCNVQQQTALAAFDAAKLKTCGHVEFPESYVYDQPLVSLILPTTTTDLDILIAILGDGLIQMIYPTGLVDPNFLSQARSIIAKLRYPKLKAELSTRRQEYQAAIATLQSSSQCFDPAALAAFTTVVGQLAAELNAVEQDLDGIYKAGLAQAVADRKAIEAQGRMRADLPYPSLTDRERELLALYLGGLSWRVRGGGLIDGGRIPLGLALTFVGPPFQLIADIAGGTEGQGVGIPLYINENAGYKDWFDMGNSPGNDKYSDLVQMTERGKRATTLTVPVLQGRGFDVRHLVAGGLMMGPCYYYIWEELPSFILGPPCTSWPGYPLPSNQPGCLEGDYKHFCEQPISNAEFCVGGALALGLVKTLLRGKPGTACTPDCHNKPCGAGDTCGGICGVCPDGGVPPQGDATVPSYDAGPAADGPKSATDGRPAATDSGSGQASGGCSTAPTLPLSTLSLILLGLFCTIWRRLSGPTHSRKRSNLTGHPSAST